MDEQEQQNIGNEEQEVNQVAPTPLTPLSPPPSHKKLIIGVVVVFVLVVAGIAGAYFFVNQRADTGPVACTAEAMICPDGSSVGRTGPNCEFAECPVSNARTEESAFVWITREYLKNIQAGDKIAGLKVTSIQPYKTDSTLPINQNAQIIFEGEVQLSGRIFKEQLIGANTCFRADELSERKLPVMYSRKELVFCLRDEENILDESSLGDSTIVIDEYELNYYPSEGFNWAKLLRIIEPQTIINDTKAFLGNISTWDAVQIELRDLHGLWGGRNIIISGNGEVDIETAGPELSRGEYSLVLEKLQVEKILIEFIENDFVNIDSFEGTLVPDESITTIHLINEKGERYSVTQRSNEKSERFKSIYIRLLEIAN